VWWHSRSYINSEGFYIAAGRGALYYRGECLVPQEILHIFNQPTKEARDKATRWFDIHLAEELTQNLEI